MTVSPVRIIGCGVAGSFVDNLVGADPRNDGHCARTGGRSRVLWPHDQEADEGLSGRAG
jgi:hypothetical protein